MRMHSGTRNKKFRKISSLFTAVALLWSAALPVSAGLFGSKPSISVPSASQSAAEIEQRYHINTGAVQEQGEVLNVADQKKMTPEVSLFFSPSDPKDGEKITARAFPIYFAQDSSKLYFTWYLQRAQCPQTGPPLSAAMSAQCDFNGDGRVNVHDWKIEAHRTIASNDFDFPLANYGADTDADGYSSRFGGDNRVNAPNRCYVHDNASGENYELADSGNISFGCGAGLSPVCMIGAGGITPDALNLSADASVGSGEASATGQTFTVGDEGPDYVSGLPTCNSDGTVSCGTGGTACCVANPSNADDCTALLTTCSGGGATVNPYCDHLFPDAPGFNSGDGSFGAAEEQFWRTDPNDASTADNGNKDEANVVGLARETFTWNYFRGDQVGVVVEGTSMIPTKHQDSSNMIMWAFSRNRCNVSGGIGSYSTTIGGYAVIIPTADMDLNDCLANNLVDPTEGGQATNLELSLVATPENPINDISDRGDGDQLEVAASVINAAQDITNTYYDWRVEISPDGTANPVAGWTNITAALNNLPNDRRLLSQVRGNGVNKVTMDLNMRSTNTFNGQPLSSYLTNGAGYLRIRVDAVENFNSAGASRRGRSTVIVKFAASQDRILAYTVGVNGSPARVTRSTQEICSGIVNPASPPEQQALTRLDAKLCRVIKNEIVGLEVPNSSGDLTNFNWTINGQQLVCNTRVSNSCFDDRQGNINFFPIIGNPGDSFTITVTANRITATTSTDRSVTISRTFKVVEPGITLASGDQNTVWPKVLGQYVDTNGAAYTEFSKDTLQTLPGNNVTVQAYFTPDFLAASQPPQVERSWMVDGVQLGDGTTNTISFPADKVGPTVYNVSLAAAYRPNTLIRQAMQDIWGISALDTTEQYFKSETQVEQPDVANITKTGVQRYFALVANYLPASVLFSLKVLFSVFLILFAAGLVFAVIPNVPDPVRARYRRE